MKALHAFRRFTFGSLRIMASGSRVYHAWLVVLLVMIGAGVFVATGIGAGLAGPGGLLIALALNGLLAFLSVMTYAELGSAIPRAGGGYSYVQESFGGFVGFLTGWISWFASTAAGSLYAVTFAIYTIRYLEVLGLLKWLPFTTLFSEKLMTVLIAVVMGILVAILLGQFGKKIPIQGSLTVKAGLFMFLLNIIAGFVLGLGEGFLGLLLGIIGIGAGAFVYGYLIEQKLPKLV